MAEPSRPTFRKAERLCSKKRIDGLFAGGRSMSAFPVRAVFALQEEGTAPVEVLVSVSKRHFKHAVDRNRLKRLIREAYRVNKQLLLDNIGDVHLTVAFIWMSDEMADFGIVEAKVRNLLQRIREDINPVRNTEA